MLLKLERGTVEHPQRTRNRTIFDKVVKREFSAGFGYHLMDPLRVARVFVVCLRLLFGILVAPTEKSNAEIVSDLLAV